MTTQEVPFLASVTSPFGELNADDASHSISVSAGVTVAVKLLVLPTSSLKECGVSFNVGLLVVGGVPMSKSPFGGLEVLPLSHDAKEKRSAEMRIVNTPPHTSKSVFHFFLQMKLFFAFCEFLKNSTTYFLRCQALRFIFCRKKF